MFQSSRWIVNGNSSVTEEETCEAEVTLPPASHLHHTEECKSWAEQSQRAELEPERFPPASQHREQVSKAKSGQTAAVSWSESFRTCTAFLMSLIVSVCFADQSLFTDETHVRLKEKKKNLLCCCLKHIFIILILINIVMQCGFLVVLFSFYKFRSHEAELV